jgi:hypothetical protein
LFIDAYGTNIEGIWFLFDALFVALVIIMGMMKKEYAC